MIFNNYILNSNDNDLEYTYEIILSDNDIARGKAIECILLKKEKNNELVIEQCQWISDYKGIKIENNFLQLLLNDFDRQSFNIYSVIDGYIVATRKINILNNTEDKYNVVFVKSDEQYEGENYKWKSWIYSKDKEGKENEFIKQTDIGLLTTTERENIIIKKESWGNNWYNPWDEQTISYKLEDKIYPHYIVYGEDSIKRSLKTVVQAIKPKIYGAIMDSKDTIIAHLSHEATDDVEFYLLVNGVMVNGIEVTINHKQIIVTNIIYDIAPSDYIELQANKTYKSCMVIKRLILNSYYYDGELGVIFRNNSIQLKLWAPTAYKVDLLIYDSYECNMDNPSSIYRMNCNNEKGIHIIDINKLENEGKYYLYKLYFITNVTNGINEYKVTYAVDPYAIATSINGGKGALININNQSAEPNKWKCDIKPTLINKEDSIIYELHVRDFTIDDSSKIKDEYKGKFLGIVEEDSRYNEVTTCLNHLKELGITHVHLLPIFDFNSVDESSDDPNNRNWGYDPQNYNVVEGAYATCSYNPITRIKEFRELIYKLHQNGIRVVMDVVYNHMASIENLNNIVPGYYFRTDDYGRLTNGSGCGNELATENLMVRKFIIDSCIHWMNNYHLDGFRFDLMELIDYDTITELLEKIKLIDNSVLIYGEPWKGGDSPVKNGISRGVQKNKGFSIFNDIFRDAIRGDNKPSNGYVNGQFFNKDIAWTILEGLQGSINTITAEPGETINYIDAHDNFTITDHLLISQNHTDIEKFMMNNDVNVLDNKYIKQVLLSFGFILFSQGIPFICGGSEFLRSKNGDHNSYKSSDNVNGFKWNLKEKYYDVFTAIKTMIKLRKSYNCFRMTSSEQVKSKLTLRFLNNDDKSGVIICHFHNNDESDVIVVFNATPFDSYYIGDFYSDLRAGSWRIVFKDFKEVNELICCDNYKEKTNIKSYSINVFVQE